ncbi:hypothetical protein GCM10010415_60040 [Streptomyces atrovirens]
MGGSRREGVRRPDGATYGDEWDGRTNVRRSTAKRYGWEGVTGWNGAGVAWWG